MKSLLIVGASSRAAAFSALANGGHVCCADLFADLDLMAACQVSKITDYPNGIDRVVHEADVEGWLFTGALENYPLLLSNWSKRIPLVGCSVESIVRVRNPQLLFSSLRQAGIKAPVTHGRLDEFPNPMRVIKKPILSGGGTNISFVHQNISTDPKFYCQQYIDGRPVAAVFVGAKNRACLVGVTQQLIGVDWCHSGGFQYCGSMGPILVTGRQGTELERIGNHLTREFNLKGIFGVDAIINDQGVYPVEVNPRYSASVEILERAFGINLIFEHVQACGGDQEKGESELLIGSPSNSPQHADRQSLLNTRSTDVHGKAILFAPYDFLISHKSAQSLLVRSQQSGFPRVADIPSPGRIRKGWPILTVFANSYHSGDVEKSLRYEIDSIKRDLGID